MENEIVSDTHSNQEASGQKPVESSAQTEDHVAYETYRKTVGEAKKAKSERDELKAKIAEYEKKELELQGKHSELIERLKEENRELKDQSEQTQTKYAWTATEKSIKSAVKDFGCVDSNAFVKLLSEDDLGLLKVDSSFNVDEKDLEMLVEQKKKQMPYLFKERNVRVHDATPNITASSMAPKAVDPLKMSDAEWQRYVMQQEKMIK